MEYPLTQPGVDLYGGKFTDGNPVGGIPASRDRAEDMNLIYDELRAVVIGAGLVPAEGNSTQVRDAIQVLSSFILDPVAVKKYKLSVSNGALVMTEQ